MTRDECSQVLWLSAGQAVCRSALLGFFYTIIPIWLQAGWLLCRILFRRMSFPVVVTEKATFYPNLTSKVTLMDSG